MSFLKIVDNESLKFKHGLTTCFFLKKDFREKTESFPFFEFSETNYSFLRKQKLDTFSVRLSQNFWHCDRDLYSIWAAL